jgi:hypothetical protein
MINLNDTKEIEQEIKLCTSNIICIHHRILFVNKNDPLVLLLGKFINHITVYTQSKIFNYTLEYQLSRPNFKLAYDALINSYADSLILLQPAVFLSADSIITPKDFNDLLYLYNVLLLYYQGFVER